MTWHLVLQVKILAPRAARAVEKQFLGYFSTITSQNRVKTVEIVTKLVKTAGIFFDQTTQNKSVVWHISWLPKFPAICRDMTWHISQDPRFWAIYRDLSSTWPRPKSSHLSKEMSRQIATGQQITRVSCTRINTHRRSLSSLDTAWRRTREISDMLLASKEVVSLCVGHTAWNKNNRPAARQASLRKYQIENHNKERIWNKVEK